MLIRNIFLTLLKFKNTFFLMFGNGLGKAVSALGALFLAKLYNPKDFGTLSIYISIFMITSCAITLQIENLIVFTENDKHARRLVTSSSFLCSLLSILLGLLLFFYHNVFITTFLKLPKEYFLVLILHLIFYGLHEFYTSWALRNTKFIIISISQIIFHFCLIGSQLILSYFWPNTALVLAMGFVVAYALSSLFLYINNQEVMNYGENFYTQLNTFKKELKKHKSYIINAIFPAIFDQIRTFIPILFLTKFFSSEMAGIFFLTLKILNFPIMLFSAAFSKSIFQEYSKTFNNKKYLFIVTHNYMRIIMAIGFIIYFLLFFLGKILIVPLIGIKWEGIALVMPILCLGACAEFISFPMLTIFPVIRKQHILAIWKLLFLIVSFIGLYFASKTQEESIFLWTYSLINSTFYIIGIMLNLRTEKSLRTHKKSYPQIF